MVNTKISILQTYCSNSFHFAPFKVLEIGRTYCILTMSISYSLYNWSYSVITILIDQIVEQLQNFSYGAPHSPKSWELFYFKNGIWRTLPFGTWLLSGQQGLSGNPMLENNNSLPTLANRKHQLVGEDLSECSYSWQEVIPIIGILVFPD